MVTKIVRLPATVEHCAAAKENTGDLPIACVILPPVEGAQRQYQPVTAHPRQRGWVGARISVGQPPPEPGRGGGADLEQLVERQEHGRRVGAGWVETNAEPDAIEFDQAFHAIG